MRGNSPVGYIENQALSKPHQYCPLRRGGVLGQATKGESSRLSKKMTGARRTCFVHGGNDIENLCKCAHHQPHLDMELVLLEKIK